MTFRRRRNGQHPQADAEQHRPAPPPSGYQPHGIDPAIAETLAALTARAEAEARAARQEEAARPAWAENILASGPRDWYGWDLTALDSPPQHARPYVPAHAGRHSPDIAADLAGLPVFREAVARHTRCHAARCACGRAMAGQAWAERMVRAGMHLTGAEAQS
jgi:hypothetical protein